MSHRVDKLPADWAGYNFHRKVEWVQCHSYPRMDYRAACRWLSLRSAEARRARSAKSRPVASRQEVDRG